MDWTTIITGIIALFGGSGLTALFTLRAAKRRAHIENDSLAIEALKNTISELRLDNQRKDEIMAQYLAEREQYRLDREDKAEENATVKNAMCLHWGCVMRHPGIGRGDEWYKCHHEDPALGGDYLPVNQLLKQYGAAKKKIETSKAEEDNDQ